MKYCNQYFRFLISSTIHFQGSKCDGNDEYSTEPTRLNLSNVVEEFLLDEDFDYDNVELTPKFSMPQINASM